MLKKKLDPMDTTDKYLAITKYLSDVYIGSICFFDKFLVIVKKKIGSDGYNG